MKLFKSLLLGSAAGLIAVSGASAADLGVKKPAPVEYVKVCSAHGAGFFYVPGSDICIQLSGRVRAEYLYATPYTRGDDISSFRSNGRLNVDVRQTTQYGLLRAYVRYDLYGSSGRYNVGSATTFGPNSMSAHGSSALDKAFIQFYTGTAGFFTAGRSTSFFDFYANNDNWTALPGSDRANTNLFAYTATFGGGFSATLSFEDQITNRRYATASLAGQSLPDVVGNLRVDQAWGSAQLSGAIHQLRYGTLQTPTSYYGTTYGFAIQGGVKINLPMIAAGDTLWLQAAYGDGATDFSGAARAVSGTTFGVLSALVNPQDAFLTATGVKKVKSWSVVASFVHNFTPTIQGAVMGGYGSVNNPVGTSADFKTYGIGAQLTWIPVRNFRIGTEVMYNVLDPAGTVATGNLLIPSKGKYDGVTARIRFQRDF